MPTAPFARPATRMTLIRHYGGDARSAFMRDFIDMP